MGEKSIQKPRWKRERGGADEWGEWALKKIVCRPQLKPGAKS